MAVSQVPEMHPAIRTERYMQFRVWSLATLPSKRITKLPPVAEQMNQPLGILLEATCEFFIQSVRSVL